MLDVVLKSAEGIASAKDLPGLRSSILSAVRNFGFAGYNLRLTRRRPLEVIENPASASWSIRSPDSYANDLWAPRDPSLLQASIGEPAFLWGESDWQLGGYREYDEYLQANGIKGGVTIPLSQGADLQGAMTLLSVSDAPLSDETLKAVGIIGHLAQARVTAVIYTPPPLAPVRHNLNALSGLQIEILDLIATGKTNREISIILEKSRRAIDYHVHEILKKLGVSSRTQAAAVHLRGQVLRSKE